MAKPEVKMKIPLLNEIKINFALSCIILLVFSRIRVLRSVIFQRNPDIKLYGLPWVFSGVVGNGTKSPYMYPELTVNYIIKWIQGAKKYHNLTIDYIGVSVFHIAVYLKTLYGWMDDLTFNPVALRMAKTP